MGPPGLCLAHASESARLNRSKMMLWFKGTGAAAWVGQEHGASGPSRAAAVGAGCIADDEEQEAIDDLCPLSPE